MKILRVLPLLMAVAALGACEFIADALTPSITGRSVAAMAPDIVPLDATQFGTPSGTSAGARIAQHRDNLAQLQQAAVEEVQRSKQLGADLDAAVGSYK